MAERWAHLNRIGAWSVQSLDGVRMPGFRPHGRARPGRAGALGLEHRATAAGLSDTLALIRPAGHSVARTRRETGERPWRDAKAGLATTDPRAAVAQPAGPDRRAVPGQPRPLMAPSRVRLASRRDGTTQFEMRTPLVTTQVRERPGRLRVVTAFHPHAIARARTPWRRVVVTS
jgi:hypothetical protein